MSRAIEPRKPVLCYVTDRRSLPAAIGLPEATGVDALLQRIEVAAAAGVDWIQLREKDLSGRELIALARSALLRVRAQNSATRLIVNDRIDIALAAGAKGVHLRESGLPVGDARRLRDDFHARRPYLPDFLIGVSCHSAEAAKAAAGSGADYICFGPVFETPSKEPYGAPQGLHRLTQVCRTVQIPVVAIGGITLANARECLAAGAAGIAAIRLFQEAGDIPGAVSHVTASIT